MVYRHSRTFLHHAVLRSNMYTGKNTMSERTKVRYDKLMKEREGKEKEYL